MNRMAVLGSIAIVLVTSAVYAAGVLRNEFVEWDDGLLITNNPMVQGLNADNIKKAFTSYDPELYIPLTFLSYQLDYAIWGLNPVGFHLTNLLLHIGNSVLVMGLVFFLFHPPPPRGEGKGEGVKGLFYPLSLTLSPRERGTSIIPFLSALLFAIHPLNTEAVMWASARKDLLMGFFFLLSLNFYLRSSDSKIAAQRFSNRCYGIIAFILACLSKVTAVMLPFILLLIDWRDYSLSLSRERARERVLEKIPYFLISLLFILIALFGKAGSHGLWWEKVLIGAKATIFYLQKLFWPTGLSVLYPYTEKISIANPDLLIPFVLVILLTLAPLSLLAGRSLLSAIALAKADGEGWALSPVRTRQTAVGLAGTGGRGGREIWREFVFGWLFFLLLLLPSFTNFAKGQDVLKDVYFASDRYAYLASIGVIYFVVFLLGCAPRYVPRVIPSDVREAQIVSREARGTLGVTQHVFYSGCFLIIFLLSFLSYHQSFVWQTTESLFTNVVQHYPNAHVAQNNLGSLLYRRGEVDRAIEKYKESLAIRPNATAFFNLGVIYMDNGYPGIAREAFTQALKLNPGDREARANLDSLP